MGSDENVGVKACFQRNSRALESTLSRSKCSAQPGEGNTSLSELG